MVHKTRFLGIWIPEVGESMQELIYPLITGLCYLTDQDWRNKNPTYLEKGIVIVGHDCFQKLR